MLLTVGMAILALGIIGIIWGIFQRMKAGRITGAPLAGTGDVASKGQAVAGDRGAISVQGKVSCPQPLVAPFSGTPCLFYEIKTTAKWKDGETTKEKELDHQKVAAAFTVDDGSGPVVVKAAEGGDFEPTSRKQETKKTGLLGGITGQDLMFGNYKVQTGILALGTEFTVEETVLPVQEHLYACGKIDGNAVGSPSWRQLLLSNKTRDELLSGASKDAKTFLIGGAAAFGVGSILAVVAGMMGGPADAPKAAAETTKAAAAGEGPKAQAGAAAAPKAATPAAAGKQPPAKK